MEQAQIGLGTTLRRTERAVHGESPRKTVLLDIEDGVAVRLNTTGAWLWGRLEEPAKVEELARGLAERFDIDEARALGDVVAFVREMLRRGLLVAS